MLLFWKARKFSVVSEKFTLWKGDIKNNRRFIKSFLSKLFKYAYPLYMPKSARMCCTLKKSLFSIVFNVSKFEYFEVRNWLEVAFSALDITFDESASVKTLSLLDGWQQSFCRGIFQWFSSWMIVQSLFAWVDFMEFREKQAVFAYLASVSFVSGFLIQ